MSKFTYETEIGSYGDPLRLSISFQVKAGITKEEYEELKTAFGVVDAIALKYKEEFDKETKE